MIIASRTTSTSRSSAQGARRPLRSVFTAVFVGLAVVSALPAQTAPDAAAPRHWEFMMSSGALVPTGAQRSAIKDAQLSTAQLSYVIGSRLAVTAMTGWARSRDLATAGTPKLDVFTYDVGAELRAPVWATVRRVTFTPLLGIGVGARSYNYRSRDVDATHNAAVYGTAGAEAGAGRVRVRLEVRDYVSRFAPLSGVGGSATRNDVVAMLGLRVVRRGA